MLVFVASIVGRVNIAVALVPSSSSIVVVSPTRRPSLLSYPRSVHRRRAPLSITIESSSRCPSPSPLRSRRPSPSKHRRGAVMPSFAVESTSRRLSPSRHVVHCHRRHRCHRRAVHRRRAFHCRRAFHRRRRRRRRVTVAPSVAVASPSHRPTCRVAVAPSIAVAVAPPSRAFSPLVAS